MKFLKTLLLGMVLALMVTPIVAFAEEVEIDTWQETRLEQVATYTPDNYDEWVRLFEAKDQLMEERDLLRTQLDEAVEMIWTPYIEEMKAEVLENLASFRESLILQVEAGELTREEAKVLYEAYAFDEKAELEVIRADRETEKAEWESEKIYYDALRADRRQMNEAIHTLIEAGETEGIAVNLNDILLINQELELRAIEVHLEMVEKIEELNNL